MVQSNVLGPGQPLSDQFFRSSIILEDIWDYRFKSVTVYIYICNEVYFLSLCILKFVYINVFYIVPILFA